MVGSGAVTHMIVARRTRHRTGGVREDIGPGADSVTDRPPGPPDEPIAADRLPMTSYIGGWLPAGGHVESGAGPWATVVRERHEELGVGAVASAAAIVRNMAYPDDCTGSYSPLSVG
ncbi:NUDIX domain-containing protein [Streptomyces sp. NPDC014684]|uniref:NUDIX domain-containing protein n=1 Tax=Streptomyces sp. NPDC014684 TaxID=3364880 RepID=UPI0036FE66C9